MNKIAFFDRDGTLNEEKNYLHKWNDFVWLPEVKDMLKLLKNKGYIIAVVTNQSGIARGYYSEHDVSKLHFEINIDLQSSHHVSIDYFELCSHHPEFSDPCKCRKPGTQMLDNILSSVGNVDLEQSFIVGDKLIDLNAGEKVGIKSYLSPFGYGKKYISEVNKNQQISSYLEFARNV